MEQVRVLVDGELWTGVVLERVGDRLLVALHGPRIGDVVWISLEKPGEKDAVFREIPEVG